MSLEFHVSRPAPRGGRPRLAGRKRARLQ